MNERLSSLDRVLKGWGNRPMELRGPFSNGSPASVCQGSSTASIRNGPYVCLRASYMYPKTQVRARIFRGMRNCHYVWFGRGYL